MPTRRTIVHPPVPIPQPEILMVRNYLKLIPKVQKEQQVINCKIAAIIRYHETCAKAAVKLAADLKKCK
jgi:hypothetical protein